MRLVKCPICKNFIPKGIKECKLCGSEFTKFQYFKMNYLKRIILILLAVVFVHNFYVIIDQNNEIKKYIKNTPDDISVVKRLEKNYQKLNYFQKQLVRKDDIELIKKRITAAKNPQTVVEEEMILYFENGSKKGIYTGEVVDGEPYGSGKFEFFSDDMKAYSYEGEFEKGTINGHGTMVIEGGEVRTGTFRNGVLNGEASIYITNERSELILIYEGEFLSNIKHGKGILYNYNGKKVYTGQFNHGLPNRREYESVCLPINYDDLYENLDKFNNTNVKIEGVVSEIDVDNNMMIRYAITPQNSYNHYIIMNNVGDPYEPVLGQSITLYGFCTGKAEISIKSGERYEGIGIDAFFIEQ